MVNNAQGHIIVYNSRVQKKKKKTQNQSQGTEIKSIHLIDSQYISSSQGIFTSPTSFPSDG